MRNSLKSLLFFCAFLGMHTTGRAVTFYSDVPLYPGGVAPYHNVFSLGLSYGDYKSPRRGFAPNAEATLQGAFSRKFISLPLLDAGYAFVVPVRFLNTRFSVGVDFSVGESKETQSQNKVSRRLNFRESFFDAAVRIPWTPVLLRGRFIQQKEKFIYNFQTKDASVPNRRLEQSYNTNRLRMGIEIPLGDTSYGYIVPRLNIFRETPASAAIKITTDDPSLGPVTYKPKAGFGVILSLPLYLSGEIEFSTISRAGRAIWASQETPDNVQVKSITVKMRF